MPQKVKTADGHSVGLVHQEFPSFFKLQSTGRRGHYDIVVLAPRFVQERTIKSLAKPKAGVSPAIRPFLCVVEVKLFYEGMSKNRASSIIQDLKKLETTSDFSSIVAFIHFQRYLRANEKQWARYWPKIEGMAKSCTNVLSTFVVYREYANCTVDVYQFRPGRTNHPPVVPR